MARALVFSNSTLSINLNFSGEIADIFYPYVGQESHVSPGGLPHKLGVFVDGDMSWTSDDDWAVDMDYHDGVLVGDTVVTNKRLGLRLELTDAIDPNSSTFVRSVHVINLGGQPKTVKVFFHQAFQIADSNASMSAQYRPDLPAVMHYRGNRTFLTTLRHKDRYFDDFSVGEFSTDGVKSTYHDAEDGRLSKNLVSNGQVDSVIGLEIKLEAHGSERLEQFLVAAESAAKAENLLAQALGTKAESLVHSAARYWQRWLEPALEVATALPDKYQKLFVRSLLFLKAHIGKNGAVIASLDNSLRCHPENDHYMFCWGRDAAYILWPLVRLGYSEEVLQYFKFVEKVLQPKGYLSHKYRPDGSLGTTWLPYQHPDGSVGEPIQADETASSLFLFGQYYRLSGDKDAVRSYYDSVIGPMANFLADFVNASGLPKPSYHLWEHDYLASTYTTAATYGALVEAAELANAADKSADAERYKKAAKTMRVAAGKLYNNKAGYFYRGIREGEKPFYDEALDVASLYGVFMYGLVDTDSRMFQDTLESVNSRLKAKNGLYVRFEGDDYVGKKETPNAWTLVSLWLAEIAVEQKRYSEAESILDKITSSAGRTGLISEQLTPDDSEPASVQPLAWSHAEYVSTLLDLLPYYTKKAHEDAEK